MSVNPLYIILLVLGSISILSSFFNMTMFVLLKRIRTEATELIFYLSIACILTNISYIMNFTENPLDSSTAICQAQGFLMLWFETSQAIWATLISYSVYNNIINDDTNHNAYKRIRYILIGFLLPFLVSLTVLLFHKIGYAQHWCWIELPADKNIRNIIYISMYSLFWCSSFLSFYYIQKVINFLEKNYTNKQEKEIIYKYIKRIRLFPIIQMSCLIPGTINRILELIGLRQSFFEYLTVIVISLEGFLYTIVFGFNPIIKTKIDEILQKCCKCFPPNTDQRENDLNNELTVKNLERSETSLN